MEPGDILQRRLLSQADLAARAGVSTRSVGAFVRGDRALRAETTADILVALMRSMPLTEPEIDALAAALGVPAERIRALQAESLEPSMAAGGATLEAGARSETHHWLEQLIGEYGLVAARRAMLRMTAELAAERARGELTGGGAGGGGGGGAGPAEPRRFVVSGPPVQREGYVERVEVEYEVTDPPAAAGTADPAAGPTAGTPEPRRRSQPGRG